MSVRDHRDRVAAVLIAVATAVAGVLAGYAETAEQRLAAVALVALASAAPALSASKKKGQGDGALVMVPPVMPFPPPVRRR